MTSAQVVETSVTVTDNSPIARSEIQMGIGNEFLNFNLIRNETHHMKDHVKISQYAKFEVV